MAGKKKKTNTRKSRKQAATKKPALKKSVANSADVKVEKKVTVAKKSDVKESINEKKSTKKQTPLKYLSEKISRVTWIGAGAVFMGFLALYLSTAPRTIVGYADSDVLLTVGNNLGVGHPPGYALYILLLNFFINSPIPGSVAFKGHVLSMVLHSGALALLFVAGVRMIKFMKLNYAKSVDVVSSSVDPLLMSLLGVIGLGTSFYFWLMGTVAEKYALLVFFTAWIIYLVMRIVVVKKSDVKLSRWVMLGGVLGAAVLYHLTAIVLVPMVAVVIWKEGVWKDAKLAGSMVVSFVVMALVSVGLVWMLNQNDAAVSWNFEPTLQGLWNHLIRSDFAGTSMKTGDEIALIPGINVQRMMATIQPYFRVLISHFNVFNVILAGLGLYMLWLSRKMKWIVYAGVLGTTVFLPLYLGWSEDFGISMIVMRNYLMGYVFMALLITLGWWLVLMRLRKIYDLLGGRKIWLSGFVILVAVCYASFSVRANYDDVYLKDDDFSHRYYTGILEDMPNDAVLACFSDISCFSLMYLQNVEGLRKDVTLIPNSYPFVKKQLDAVPGLKGFDYEDNPYLTFDYLTWNVGKRPVMVVDMSKQMFDLLGVPLAFIYYIPHGYYGEISNVIPEDYQPVQDYSYTDELKYIEYSPKNYAANWYKMTLARTHQFNGLNYIIMDKRSWSTREFNLMADLMYDVKQIDHNNIEGSRATLERSRPTGGHTLGVRNDSEEQVERIRNGIDEYMDKGQLLRSALGLRALLIIDPMDFDTRIKLAEVYEKMNDFKFAEIEYKNVLKYRPENQEIQEKVRALEELN